MKTILFIECRQMNWLRNKNYMKCYIEISLAIEYMYMVIVLSRFNRWLIQLDTQFKNNLNIELRSYTWNKNCYRQEQLVRVDQYRTPKFLSQIEQQPREDSHRRSGYDDMASLTPVSLTPCCRVFIYLFFIFFIFMGEEQKEREVAFPSIRFPLRSSQKGPRGNILMKNSIFFPCQSSVFFHFLP